MRIGAQSLRCAPGPFALPFKPRADSSQLWLMRGAALQDLEEESSTGDSGSSSGFEDDLVRTSGKRVCIAHRQTPRRSMKVMATRRLTGKDILKRP